MLGRARKEPPLLTVVIAAFDMADQLARTLHSLSPAMQRGVRGEDYELIVVDNGSEPALELTEGEHGGVQLRVIRIDDAPPSPAPALNRGIAAARAPLVCAMIDGARLASPGLLANGIAADRTTARAVVCSHGFHLGADVQQRTAATGYDVAAEAALLERIEWPADGYRLFEIAVPAPSSRRGASSPAGWLDMPSETNSLFMRTELWDELGGFEERFAAPGGGMVNPDMLARACAAPGAQPIVLLGEGTFHQVHGGVTTNRRDHRPGVFLEEYERLRGHRAQWPRAEPLFFGSLSPAARGAFDGGPT